MRVLVLNKLMKLIAFGANFLWVLILGLLGPALPGIIRDLQIDYARAGMFFSVVSFGGLFGTTIGSILSDFVDRRLIFLVSSVFLVGSLVLMSISSSFLYFILALLLLSILGSPIGAVGQGMVLEKYPEKREVNLTIQSIFAASGSFVAPLMISLNYTFGEGWRLAFVEAALMGGMLFLGMFFVRNFNKGGEEKITQKDKGLSDVRSEENGFRRVMRIFSNKRVLFSFVLMFLFVGTDFGFSYWLAEYSKSELALDITVSSAVVLFYIGGVIIGRIVGLFLLKRFSSGWILKYLPIVSVISFVGFLLVNIIPVKFLFIVLYGFGLSPMFPLLMSYGTEAVPENPGVVTGLLFASLSFGGIVFPLLIGIIAMKVGLQSAFLFILLLLIVIMLSIWRVFKVRFWSKSWGH